MPQYARSLYQTLYLGKASEVQAIESDFIVLKRARIVSRSYLLAMSQPTDEHTMAARR